jgi:excisionase family DNA binding protein
MADTSDRPGPDEDPWLTVQQVSEELKIHPATVRVWIKQGRLHAVRAGKGYRARRSEVDRALRAEEPPESLQARPRSRGDSPAQTSPNPAPRQIADQIITVVPAAGSAS